MAIACSIAATSSAASRATAATVTLPDLQIKVPTNLISIGTDPVTGHRMLRFTHITWDAGAGPFEIDPTYDSATGTATFAQSIYDSPSPGVWSLDHTVPLPVTGVFDSPDDYQFPLTSFTLNALNSDGTLGPVVATSPKIDYCITGDTYVGGVPNTPNQSFIPTSNCGDPTKPLGWSVGWGDQYDQTDSGQPIDLTGVPDGTYVLHAMVDPLHVLTESNSANDVTDTTLRISGNTVTVLSQTMPGTSPPAVSITSPAGGSNVSGTVALQATASAFPPATISSVQFLLDGQPLGSPITTPPYTYNWTVGSTALGSHNIAVRATDSNGIVGTSQAVPVNVVASNPAGFVVDQSVKATGSGTVTTAGFNTAGSADTLVAFVSSDSAGSGGQTATVSGAGLAWSLVKRSNSRPGDAEIWTAQANGPLSNATVSAKLGQAAYSAQLTVLAFAGSAGVGASASAAAASGAPSVSLTTTAGGSLSYAVGNDYDSGTPRTIGPGQTMVNQWVNTTTGDTFWVQGASAPSTAAGQPVTLNDTAPTADQWDFAAVEVVPASPPPPPPPDTTPPTVSITNPTVGQTVSATIPVAADASDNVAVASVQFFLDGSPLGSPVTAAPYAVNWDTTTANSGTHTLSAKATDTSGNVGTSANVVVTVQNPPPPMTCFVLQAQVSVHGSGTVTTPSFHTAVAGETILAFVSADGPAGAGKQTVAVSGAGLTWKLVKRANAQSGDSEVWAATASTVLSGVTVTSTELKSGYSQDLTVIAMEGTAGVGASVAASAPTGAPTVNLTTTKATSLVFAVGNDWDRAVARTLPAGWVKLNQWVNTNAGDTYWSQYTNQPTGPAGSVVIASDTAPTNDQWNLVAVELINSGG
jgi:Bacterial Ig domain/Lysyl oxidase